MDNNSQQVKCEIHSLEYLAIDQSSSQDLQNRYLCAKCLTKKIKGCNIQLINDAQNTFNQAKLVFEQRKENQNTTNLGVLKNLTSNIVSLQNHCNQTFEKILQNIQQWATSIYEQKEKLSEQLKDVNIDQYYFSSPNTETQIDHNELKNAILTQLDSISNKHLLDSCVTTFSRLDDSIITLEYDIHFEEDKADEKQRTPFLPLICEQHQLEIVQFDLNQEQAKTNRLVCICCSSGKVGPFTDILTVKKLWSDIENMKNKSFDNQKQSYKLKVDQTIESLTQMLSQLQNQVISVSQELNNKLYEFNDFNDKNIGQTDWQLLSKEKVINIAEILSNPQLNEQVKNNNEQLFEKQNQEINEIIRQASLHFQKIYQTCVHSLKNLINQKQMNQISNVDTQTQTTEIQQKIEEIQTSKSFNFCNNIIDIGIFKEQTIQMTRECQTFFELSECKQILKIGKCKVNILKQQKTQFHISYLYKRPKPANYQLQQQYSITQNEYSYAIAINSKQTIMIAGCENQIKVFEFQNGQMKQTQLLSDHTSYVNTLYFMKKTNQFISGSYDNTIRIWNIKDNQQYYCQQLLNNKHTGRVNQVIMNTNEDLIISCSDDQSIKFWIKKTEWECNQTLTVHTSYVWQISLNDQENQLVSCGWDSQIIISQLDKDNKWDVYQTIKVEQYGYRICYIGDNMIAFQQFNAQKMDIFELNQQNKQFIKSKDIKIENDGNCYPWFPQIFNKQKSILLNKNGQKINLMKRKNNGEIVLEQTIKFGDCYVYGTMTEDGEYLITWDQTSKQFQVRKQQQ